MLSALHERLVVGSLAWGRVGIAEFERRRCRRDPGFGGGSEGAAQAPFD